MLGLCEVFEELMTARIIVSIVNLNSVLDMSYDVMNAQC